MDNLKIHEVIFPVIKLEMAYTQEQVESISKIVRLMYSSAAFLNGTVEYNNSFVNGNENRFIRLMYSVSFTDGTFMNVELSYSYERGTEKLDLFFTDTTVKDYYTLSMIFNKSFCIYDTYKRGLIQSFRQLPPTN